jgi:hypothetical protein
MSIAYSDFGEAAHIPGGRTAPEFVRWCLDTIGVCEWMQRVKFSGKTYLLPQSTLPGAAPEAEPIGRGRRQNTKEAQVTRVAEAEAKRAELATKQAQAEARMGRRRKRVAPMPRLTFIVFLSLGRPALQHRSCRPSSTQ